jgi:hypothetical protein
MVQRHDSTPAQRAQVVCQMITHAGDYGFVTQLSRHLGVSRQTLYTWTEQGSRALQQAFRPGPVVVPVTPTLERAILTLLVEGHASVRGIQACLRATTGQHVSVGTIVAVLADAEGRALAWMTTHVPPTSRALALDEIYGRHRRGAYLNVVDLDSWAVWAAEGPLAVDAETWTLVLWEAQARGLRWHATVSDGAPAMQQACATVDPAGQHGRDVWHLLQTCSQIQGRVERVVATLEAQAATAQRYAARVAAGERPRGRQPAALAAAHAGQLACARRTTQALRYLTAELHTLLEVVVLRPTGVLDAVARQADLDTLLRLLAEVRDEGHCGRGPRGAPAQLAHDLEPGAAGGAGVCGRRGAGAAGGAQRRRRARAGADRLGLATAADPGARPGGVGGRAASGMAAGSAGAGRDLGWRRTGEQCGGKLAQYPAPASGRASDPVGGRAGAVGGLA